MLRKNSSPGSICRGGLARDRRSLKQHYDVFPGVVSLAYRMLKSRKTAEDALQEVLASNLEEGAPVFDPTHGGG
jgi:DNA-directed RNA polymerase specialized sigma24 family protein